MSFYEIFTLFSVVALLSIHGYLNYFYIKNELPYVFGFLIFVKVEYLAILISGILILGWIFGIIAFLVLLLGGSYIFVPIVMVLHSITGTNDNSFAALIVGKTGPNEILYGLWTLLTLLFLVITVINIFI